ncbi:hypothetical protein R1sor_010478 [Riccia sorocarpa]|uniref:Reverse transcriptase domain-containing protein n=1 Tax=Riccia sorocarpa TaxID=122646 RepID=A0ABD3I1V4_9MARC
MGGSDLWQQQDLIVLAETWETSDISSVDFPGFTLVTSVWNKKRTNRGRGFGGLTAWVRMGIGLDVNVHHIDKRNQFFVLRIQLKKRSPPMFFVFCYFAPFGAPVYKELHEDISPMADLSLVVRDLLEALALQCAGFLTRRVSFEGQSDRFKLDAALRTKYEDEVGLRLGASSEPSLPLVLMDSARHVFPPARSKDRTWFDVSCRTAREAALHCAPEDRSAAYRKYRHFIRARKRLWLRKFQDTLAEDLMRQPETFWRRLKKPMPPSELPSNELYAYLEKLYHSSDAETLLLPPDNPCSFSEDEVIQVLNKMESGKARDLQGLAVELLKWGGTAVFTALTQMINRSEVPDDWCHRKVVPLFKGGSRSDPGSYRTILIGSIFAWVLGKLIDKRLSSWCDTHNKRAPGCPASPTLFSLIIDELFWSMQEPMEGVNLGTSTVPMLIFADDVALFADNAAQMESHIRNLEGFCADSGMTVNLDKTRWICVGKQSMERFQFQGREIEQCKSYKYLGIEISANLSWSLCVQSRINGGFKALYALRGICKKVDLWAWQLRGHLFNTLVIPVALYGVPIWGPALPRSSWKKVEAIQKSFLQKEFGVRVQIPYSILLAESGRLPLEVEALILTLQFVFRLRKLENDRHSRMALLQSQSLGWFADVFIWANRWDFPEIEWSSESAIRSKLSILAVQKLWESPTPRQIYYTRDINRMTKYEEQPYLRGKLPRHIRQLISRYRTSSHSLYVAALRVLYWNVHGFSDMVAEGGRTLWRNTDVIMLSETWEWRGEEVVIEGFVRIGSVMNSQRSDKGRGFGGIAVWSREGQAAQISLEFEDPGSSVVDFLLVTEMARSLVSSFRLEEFTPESDHRALTCSFGTIQVPKTSTKKGSWAICLDWKRKELYAERLETEMARAGEVFAEELSKLLLRTARGVFCSRRVLAKSWFDTSCIEARRKVMASTADDRQVEFKAYRNLVRGKRRQYLRTLQKELMEELQQNPRSFWNRLKQQKPKSKLTNEALMGDSFWPGIYVSGEPDRKMQRV